MESTLIRGSIRVVEESCAFLRVKKPASFGEGWTHYEVNSNDGVNPNTGVERNGGSSPHIFLCVEIPILSLRKIDS